MSPFQWPKLGVGGRGGDHSIEIGVICIVSYTEVNLGTLLLGKRSIILYKSLHCDLYKKAKQVDTQIHKMCDSTFPVCFTEIKSIISFRHNFVENLVK